MFHAFDFDVLTRYVNGAPRFTPTDSLIRDEEGKSFPVGVEMGGN